MWKHRRSIGYSPSHIAEEVDGSYCLQMAGKWPWPGQAGRGRESIASSEMSSGARASSSLVLCSRGSSSRAETEQPSTGPAQTYNSITCRAALGPAGGARWGDLSTIHRQPLIHCAEERIVTGQRDFAKCAQKRPILCEIWMLVWKD